MVPKGFARMWVRDLTLFSGASVVLVVLLVVVGIRVPPRGLESPLAAEQFTRAPPEADAESRYERHRAHGFSAYFDRSWFRSESDSGRAMLHALDDELRTMSRIFPPEALAGFAEVPLWIEWNEAAVPGLGPEAEGFVAYYLPGARREYYYRQRRGRNGGVTVLASKVLDASGEEVSAVSPYWLAHELAHAHHDRVLGSDHPDVIAAYRAAMEARLYEKVPVKLRNRPGPDGLELKRAYAATNHYEYFAELSVAYLSWNPYYPHTRSDLARHDPRGHALMAKVWGDNSAQRQKVVGAVSAALAVGLVR